MRMADELYELLHSGDSSGILPEEFETTAQRLVRQGVLLEDAAVEVLRKALGCKELAMPRIAACQVLQELWLLVPVAEFRSLMSAHGLLRQLALQLNSRNIAVLDAALVTLIDCARIRGMAEQLWALGVTRATADLYCSATHSSSGGSSGAGSNGNSITDGGAGSNTGGDGSNTGGAGSKGGKACIAISPEAAAEGCSLRRLQMACLQLLCQLMMADYPGSLPAGMGGHLMKAPKEARTTARYIVRCGLATEVVDNLLYRTRMAQHGGRRLPAATATADAATAACDASVAAAGPTASAEDGEAQATAFYNPAPAGDGGDTTATTSGSHTTLAGVAIPTYDGAELGYRRGTQLLALVAVMHKQPEELVAASGRLLGELAYFAALPPTSSVPLRLAVCSSLECAATLMRRGALDPDAAAASGLVAAAVEAARRPGWAAASAMANRSCSSNGASALAAATAMANSGSTSRSGSADSAPTVLQPRSGLGNGGPGSGGPGSGGLGSGGVKTAAATAFADELERMLDDGLEPPFEALTLLRSLAKAPGGPADWRREEPFASAVTELARLAAGGSAGATAAAAAGTVAEGAGAGCMGPQREGSDREVPADAGKLLLRLVELGRLERGYVRDAVLAPLAERAAAEMRSGGVGGAGCVHSAGEALMAAAEQTRCDGPTATPNTLTAAGLLMVGGVRSVSVRGSANSSDVPIAGPWAASELRGMLEQLLGGGW